VHRAAAPSAEKGLCADSAVCVKAAVETLNADKPQRDPARAVALLDVACTRDPRVCQLYFAAVAAVGDAAAVHRAVGDLPAVCSHVSNTACMSSITLLLQSDLLAAADTPDIIRLVTTACHPIDSRRCTDALLAARQIADGQIVQPRSLRSDRVTGPPEPSSDGGGLTGQEVGSIIRSHWPGVRACYELELLRDLRLSGQLSVHLQIGSEGQVATARLNSSDLRAPHLEACTLRLARRWRFPRPRKGGFVDVNYPFVFEPPSAISPEAGNARSTAGDI
jgi:hypothetical protein